MRILLFSDVYDAPEGQDNFFPQFIKEAKRTGHSITQVHDVGALQNERSTDGYDVVIGEASYSNAIDEIQAIHEEIPTLAVGVMDLLDDLPQKGKKDALEDAGIGVFSIPPGKNANMETLLFRIKKHIENQAAASTADAEAQATGAAESVEGGADQKGNTITPYDVSPFSLSL